MNTIKLMAGAVTLATLGMASAYGADQAGFHFSIGAEGGFAGGQSDVSKTLNGTAAGGGNNSSTSTADVGTQGAGGGAMLSVGYLFEGGFCLGLEGSAMWYSSDAKLGVRNGVFTNTKVEMKDSYNVMGCFGFKTTDCVIPFIRLGAAFSKWEGDCRGNGAGKRDEYLTGFVAGLGVDFMVSKSIAIGFVYDHAWYNDMSYKGYDPNGAEISSTKIKPEINTFKARVRFVF